MSGIGIVANPHSKLNKRNPQLQQVLGYILGQSGQLAVTNTLEQLGAVAREFREKGISILAINGGDGTISRTLTAFIREYGTQPLPHIAILRGGTINALALNLGIKGSPEQVLYRLLERISSGIPLHTEKLRTIKIKDNYGFLFGNGVVANFLKLFYENKSGPIGSALLVLRLYFAYFFNRPVYEAVISNHHQKISQDGRQPSDFKTISIMASTIEKMPLGPPLFKLARRRPGQFQAIVYSIDADDLPMRFPTLLGGVSEGSSSGKTSFVCSKLKIHAPTAQLYTLDGELYEMESDELEIEIGPELEFLVV